MSHSLQLAFLLEVKLDRVKVECLKRQLVLVGNSWREGDLAHIRGAVSPS